MGIVLPHIIWAPSSRSSCCLLPQLPLCVPRPTQLSPTPRATTFPTPTALHSPTPQPRPLSSPTPTLLWSTPPLLDASLPTAMLLTHTPVTTATTGLATTTVTMAGRRGRRPLRLMLRLLPRPTLGCCMVATVFLMAATTATATTTPPMPTLEAAATTLVVLSP